MLGFRLCSRLSKDLFWTQFAVGRHALQKKASLRGQWDDRGYFFAALRTGVQQVQMRLVEPTVGIAEV